MSRDRFSAREQGLGYLYQPRFALLQMLQLPEQTSVFIEKDDDLDFVDVDGRKALGSLKHKAPGERLTDLSTDFWKSVRTRSRPTGRLLRPAASTPGPGGNASWPCACSAPWSSSAGRRPSAATTRSWHGGRRTPYGRRRC